MSNVFALALISYGFGISVTKVFRAFCGRPDAEAIKEMDLWLAEQNLTEFSPYLHEKGKRGGVCFGNASNVTFRQFPITEKFLIPSGHVD